MDNCFTNLPLTEQLLSEYHLTVIAIIEKNKRELLQEFKDKKYNDRQVEISIFPFTMMWLLSPTRQKVTNLFSWSLRFI